ncbi:unnamed protein product [Rangifer tarandus platyrhynchus]|uniref:Secreted protein n=2 Tax=Rangifer tarandus platyrhynchus TaxID=3082113 RepID=A0ABN8ZY79_RANTA|nr:unnamed protein product [Rangifer tarandus platyrhynchus]CAI9712151.1 unnamed protein product [Rangifer tarandus platyrhynchus]
MWESFSTSRKGAWPLLYFCIWERVLVPSSFSRANLQKTSPKSSRGTTLRLKAEPRDREVRQACRCRSTRCWMTASTSGEIQMNLETHG